MCQVRLGEGPLSKFWLEKHVMSHGGNKPFQFIVDGCEHRFGTHVWNTAYFNMWDPMCQVWLGLVSCRKGSLSITSEDRTAKLVFFYCEVRSC